MTAAKKLPVYSIRSQAADFVLYRNDEPMQTPRGLPLAVTQQKLADALLQECVAQTEERLDLRKMPMTQMTLTVIDIASSQRGPIIDGIIRYGDSELVCQRASDPADLVAEQNSVWQPYLDWAREKFNVALITGSGIIPFKQKPETLDALRAFVETSDDYRLIGISEAVGISGSLILGLALATGRADVVSVFTAAELDALWQIRKWGEDPAVTARHADIQRDLSDCARWFELVG